MLLFVSHPEIVVDPAVPVPRWQLSPVGIARARAFARRIPAAARIVASDETKAIETAGLIAAAHGLPVAVHPGLAEFDRSATGYVPHDEHDAIADACFAHPEESARGWERAVDAQARILAAWREIATAVPGPALLVGHGGTGTLLLCALAGLPIARSRDQSHGGCAWAHDGTRLLFAWTPFEAVTPRPLPAGAGLSAADTGRS